MSFDDLPKVVNYQNPEKEIPQRVEKFAKQNMLNMVREKSKADFGFPCFLWWPQHKVFTPVKSISIYEDNAKFLRVAYYRPKSHEL